VYANVIVNTKTGKLLTAPEINKRGTEFILDDYDRTSQLKKIEGNNPQWGQRYSFKDNSGIVVTKSKNNMVVDVSVGVVDNNEIHIWTWHGGDNQLWEYNQESLDIKLKNNDLYLTTKKDESNNGTKVIASSTPGI